MTTFSCNVIGDSKTVILKLAGRMTYAEVPDFERHSSEAAAANPAVLVLDMSDISAMSSAGIGALLKLDVKMRAQKCPLRIAAPAPNIAEVFRMARLNDVLTILPSVAAALH